MNPQLNRPQASNIVSFFAVLIPTNAPVSDATLTNVTFDATNQGVADTKAKKYATAKGLTVLACGPFNLVRPENIGQYQFLDI